MREIDESSRWHREFVTRYHEMAEEVRPLVVGVADVRGKLLGSGILARHGTSHFLITAGHVVRDVHSTLARDELALVTMVKKGAIRLPPRTKTVSEYEPNADDYQDAGLMRLEPETVSAISAWSNHRWFPIPAGPVPDELHIDEVGRVFFVTGFPAQFAKNEVLPREQKLVASYCCIGMHRHPTLKRSGAIAFAVPPEDMFDLDAGSRLKDGLNLAGLSGAPLWTFDISETESRLRFIGVHSASNADTALAVHIRVSVRPIASLTAAPGSSSAGGRRVEEGERAVRVGGEAIADVGQVARGAPVDGRELEETVR